MDREKSKANNQEININRVVREIGLPTQIEYNKIDVFIDNTHKNNVWAIVEYTEFDKKKATKKQEVVRFASYEEMLSFVRSHFDGYELSHRVEYSKRKIFLHSIDYLNIMYYLHEGKPKLNYLEINYKEYVNDGFRVGKKRIPKEYHDMFLEILRINKGLDKNSRLNGDLYRIIDVYAKKEKYEKEPKEPIMILERPKKHSLKNINNPKPNRNHGIRNLAILATAVTLSVVTTGYVLQKNTEYKKEIVTQKNASIFGKDGYISNNKEKAATIISKLFEDDYQDVSEEDMNFVLEFIKEVSHSNFDKNSSSTAFEYLEFFSSKFYTDSFDVRDASIMNEVLEKIEKLYKKCFNLVGDELILNKEGAKEYIDYVASLTFMYDTLVDQRNSGLLGESNQSITSIYATREEIEAYNKCPSIFKYIVLSQLDDMLMHSNYQVTSHPSNYRNGKDIDKYNLINDVRKIEDDLQHSMMSNSRSFSEKTI